MDRFDDPKTVEGHSLRTLRDATDQIVGYLRRHRGRAADHDAGADGDPEGNPSWGSTQDFIAKNKVKNIRLSAKLPPSNRRSANRGTSSNKATDARGNARRCARLHLLRWRERRDDRRTHATENRICGKASPERTRISSLQSLQLQHPSYRFDRRDARAKLV
ncbi:hypothetical protein [Bradyrhizobium sp. LMTR 3]|uniref:hypothetical protein n=1 Tax=Bradyrhizobium sp. LMTR 3 TaxID=189873 RepID=UPI0011466986|nr:hypothetical protein [Bradyrhizobium sp. LMTR 3]